MPDAYPDQSLAELIADRRSWHTRDGNLPDHPLVVCAGSFNPLHPAHMQLLKIGEQKTGLPGIFELSITNVDKPPLNLAEIEERSVQFQAKGLRLVLTNRPRYLGKIEIFPRGSVFVMGSDTFERVVSPRYYHTSELPLDLFEAAKAHFVVAARRNREGLILTAEDVLQSTQHPLRWGKLTTCISPDEFLMDISSTGIRARLNF